MTTQRSGKVRLVVFLVVVSAVALTAYVHLRDLSHAARLALAASPFWLIVAVVAIGGVYAARALVYNVGLEILGHSLGRWFLAGAALVATSLHQLFPVAGFSGYAYLVYAFRQRGVGSGRASLIALIDTLSYAVSIGLLIAASLLYLALRPGGTGGRLFSLLAPGLAIFAAAVFVYVQQRRRERFVPLVLRWKDRLAALLRRRWPDEPACRFLDQYYESKAEIRRRPRAFLSMVALQYVAIACDCLALYVICVSLGLLPSVWTIFLGFVVAMTGMSIIGVPAGGGSFEVLMSAFFISQGIRPATAIAVTLLYRLIAFWIPVCGSLVVSPLLRASTPRRGGGGGWRRRSSRCRDTHSLSAWS